MLGVSCFRISACMTAHLSIDFLSETVFLNIEILKSFCQYQVLNISAASFVQRSDLRREI